jgi:hypothetical protein
MGAGSDPASICPANSPIASVVHPSRARILIIVTGESWHAPEFGVERGLKLRGNKRKNPTLMLEAI